MTLPPVSPLLASFVEAINGTTSLQGCISLHNDGLRRVAYGLVLHLLDFNNTMAQPAQPFTTDDEYGDQSSLSSRLDLAANYLTVRKDLGIDTDAPMLPAHTGEFATQQSGKTAHPLSHQLRK